MKNKLDAVQSQIGYIFSDQVLLKAALTHRSFSSDHNERLEFLGDSILNFVIAEALFQQFPEIKEGQLSRLRSQLVKGETLAEIAREFALSDYVRLGEGELRSGGAERASILADCVEAIIGAMYFDSTFEVTKNCILKWFESRLKTLAIKSNDAKDAKSVLQEWLQAKSKPLPSYKVVDVAGESHAQAYTVECSCSMTSERSRATAQNRKTAEKLAAKAMLNILKIS